MKNKKEKLMRDFRTMFLILAAMLLMAGIIGEVWIYHLEFRSRCLRAETLLQQAQKQIDYYSISLEQCRRENARGD